MKPPAGLPWPPLPRGFYQRHAAEVAPELLVQLEKSESTQADLERNLAELANSYRQITGINAFILFCFVLIFPRMGRGKGVSHNFIIITERVKIILKSQNNIHYCLNTPRLYIIAIVV